MSCYWALVGHSFLLCQVQQSIRMTMKPTTLISIQHEMTVGYQTVVALQRRRWNSSLLPAHRRQHPRTTGQCLGRVTSVLICTSCSQTASTPADSQTLSRASWQTATSQGVRGGCFVVDEYMYLLEHCLSELRFSGLCGKNYSVTCTNPMFEPRRLA